jgi:hypothetical protein
LAAEHGTGTKGRRMMDTASAADQSWPTYNRQFRRSWKPPQKRKRQGLATPAPSQHFEISNVPEYSPAEGAAQRAIAAASRRAAKIDRTADLLLSVGRVDAAERLAHRAAEIRAVLA